MVKDVTKVHKCHMDGQRMLECVWGNAPQITFFACSEIDSEAFWGY